MASRRTGILALICLSVFTVVFLWSVQTASARTWTSQDGRKVSGRFVRVHQGQVVLRRGRGVVQVPFEMFSDEDQDYIRNKLKVEGKEHLLPSKSSKPDMMPGSEPSDMPGGMPVAEPGAMPGENSGGMAGAKERTWTDVKGRKITAKFVRMSGNLVVLNKGGKEVKVSLDQLSMADQHYAMQADARAKMGGNKGPWGTHQPPMKGPGGPMPPGGSAEESEMQRALRAEAERRKNAANRPPSHTPPGMAGHNSPSTPMGGYTPPSPPPVSHTPSPSPPITSHVPAHTPHRPPAMPAMPAMPSHHRPSMPSMPSHPTIPSTHHSPYRQMEVYQCSNCKGTITKKLKPGDKCPHCGIFIQYIEHEDGTREEASAISQIGWRGRRFFISLAVFVVLSVLGAIFRNR